jgi:hypothetical protein
MERTTKAQQVVLITKPELAESLRTDKRIVSIVTRPKSTIESKRPNAFTVSDLLSNGAYMIEFWNGLYQLTFQTDNRELVVTIQPHADLMEIADMIMNHLERIVESS